MESKRKNRNSFRTRRMICDAFLALLDEKNYEKITVTDITKRADINRTTFYNHYPDVYGIVEDLQNNIIKKNLQIIQQLEYRNILKNPMPYLESLSDTLKENMQLFKRMGHTPQLHQYLDRYRQLMAEDIINDSSIPEYVRQSSFFYIHIHFFIGGIMNTYQQWTTGNLSCSLDEINLEIASIIQKTGRVFLEINWNKLGDNIANLSI